MLRRLLILAFLAAAAACAGGSSDDGVNTTEIIPLDENRLTNFLAVLPDVLDFADAYNARLTPRDREDPDANTKYFQALRDSTRIRAAADQRGFESVDELMLIYKNVLLEYIAIKRELTNWSAISNVRLRIDEVRSNTAARLQSGSVGQKEIRELRQQLEDLKKDEIRYANILLIKQHESEIDRVSRNR